ncbi:ASCH domain-containing protein [Sphingomonas koreensis]|uniref:ASCH domain-containing protein n=1 Tax=Sphingomonas koreensis TaxID=93064 RepID=UPI000F7DC64B|nr:ASCH domain-containing protein [Sphingomonas koreensis]RSU30265.1 ASCH domain-containing protein [Sphingomonas koreensis]
MLFRRDTLEGVANGTITLAFRRWRSAAAVTGGTQRTTHGVVRFGLVERIELMAIDAEEAVAAGYADRDVLLRELNSRPGDLYRIELAGIDDDPREALREQADVDPDILAWLVRIDWALPILRAIDQAPEVRAADIAEPLGMQRDRFKARVRELKNRGLTISLETGYRISPRGAAALAKLSRSA